MLASLATIKQRLGITGTADDALLLGLIAQTSAMVRDIRKSWIGSVLHSIDATGLVTAYSHQLDDGDTLRIYGTGNANLDYVATAATPIEHTIVYLTPDTFRIGVTGETVDGAGWVRRQAVGFLQSNGHPTVFLPSECHSVTEVKLKGDVLTEGTDYVFDKGTVGKYNGLSRVRGVWPASFTRAPGTLRYGYVGPNRDIEYTAWIGQAGGGGAESSLIAGAMSEVVDELRTTIGVSSNTASHSYEGASESFFSPQQMEASGGGGGEGGDSGPYAILKGMLGGGKFGF